MTFLERLQTLSDEDKATEIKKAVTDGIESDFGEWVLVHFKDAIDEHYQAILRVTDPQDTTRLVAGLQAIERLRSQLLEGVTDGS